LSGIKLIWLLNSLERRHLLSARNQLFRSTPFNSRIYPSWTFPLQSYYIKGLISSSTKDFYFVSILFWHREKESIRLIREWKNGKWLFFVYSDESTMVAEKVLARRASENI